jgi:Effector protein
VVARTFAAVECLYGVAMADAVDVTELDYDFLGLSFPQLQQYKKFNKYIEKHASPFQASMLQWDFGDSVTDQGLPNGILIAYRSMGSWMVVNHQTADDHHGKFEQLKHRYLADKESYKRQILGLLKQIQQYPTGRALLDQFTKGASLVRIRPYNMTEPNALTLANDIDQQKYTVARGARLNYDPKNTELYKVIGEGGGANCNILFSPEVVEALRQKIRKAHLGHAPAMAADEVLYHELVHASRMVAGLMNTKAANRWYQDTEEYLAVILANIYVSDKGGAPAFRAFYSDPPGGYKPKDPRPDDVLWDADIFLDNPQKTNPSPMDMIEGFRLSQPGFYWKLAQLAPSGWVRKYNWVYWYEQRRIAKSKATAARR